MAEEIRSLNGYTFKDEVARAQTAQLTEEIGGISEYNNGLSEDILKLIPTGIITDELTLSEDHKVYDFRGATVGKLNIACISSVVKNFKTKETVTVKSGSRNCTIENARFENTTQSVLFETNTWAYLFDRCTFIGGENAVCMNAETYTNDTLILNNCYWYNFNKIIECKTNIHTTINGGWCDSVEYIVYAGANLNTCTLNITRFDAEEVAAVFKSTAYTNATVMFSGIITPTSGCIVDYASGVVNLFLECTVSKNLKIFSDTCPKTRHVNIKSMTECEYRFADTAYEQTVTIRIPPKETVQPFGNRVHVQSADCDNANVVFYINGYLYEKGSAYGGVVNFQIKNTSDAFVTADIVMNSMCILQ